MIQINKENQSKNFEPILEKIKFLEEKTKKLEADKDVIKNYMKKLEEENKIIKEKIEKIEKDFYGEKDEKFKLIKN